MNGRYFAGKQVNCAATWFSWYWVYPRSRKA